MSKFVITLLAFTMGLFSFSQSQEFVKLEEAYQEGKYETVFRQSKNLIDNPEFDNSFIPRYYFLLSTTQLSSNEKWGAKKFNAIEQSAIYFNEINESREGKSFLSKRQEEIAFLKEKLEANNIAIVYEPVVTEILAKINTICKVEVTNNLLELDDSELSCEDTENDGFALDSTGNESEEKAAELFKMSERQRMLSYAETFQGVRYLFGGESPNGFDCSGFTGYVFDRVFDIKTERSARAQYSEIQKISKEEVLPGDLIFFTNRGPGVGHVGIIYSVDGNDMKMIHASSKRGIVIVDVFPSTHWPKKIVGYGRYLQDDYMKQAFVIENMNYYKVDNSASSQDSKENNKL